MPLTSDVSGRFPLVAAAGQYIEHAVRQPGLLPQPVSRIAVIGVMDAALMTRVLPVAMHSGAISASTSAREVEGRCPEHATGSR